MILLVGALAIVVYIYMHELNLGYLKFTTEKTRDIWLSTVRSKAAWRFASISKNQWIIITKTKQSRFLDWSRNCAKILPHVNFCVKGYKFTVIALTPWTGERNPLNLKW